MLELTIAGFTVDQKVVHVIIAKVKMILVTAAERMEWVVMGIALNRQWITFRSHIMYVLGKISVIKVSDPQISINLKNSNDISDIS